MRLFDYTSAALPKDEKLNQLKKLLQHLYISNFTKSFGTILLQLTKCIKKKGKRLKMSNEKGFALKQKKTLKQMDKTLLHRKGEKR